MNKRKIIGILTLLLLTSSVLIYVNKSNAVFEDEVRCARVIVGAGQTIPAGGFDSQAACEGAGRLPPTPDPSLYTYTCPIGWHENSCPDTHDEQYHMIENGVTCYSCIPRSTSQTTTTTNPVPAPNPEEIAEQEDRLIECSDAIVSGQANQGYIPDACEGVEGIDVISGEDRVCLENINAIDRRQGFESSEYTDEECRDRLSAAFPALFPQEVTTLLATIQSQEQGCIEQFNDSGLRPLDPSDPCQRIVDEFIGDLDQTSGENLITQLSHQALEPIIDPFIRGVYVPLLESLWGEQATQDYLQGIVSGTTSDPFFGGYVSSCSEGFDIDCLGGSTVLGGGSTLAAGGIVAGGGALAGTTFGQAVAEYGLGNALYSYGSAYSGAIAAGVASIPGVQAVGNFLNNPAFHHVSAVVSGLGIYGDAQARQASGDVVQPSIGDFLTMALSEMGTLGRIWDAVNNPYDDYLSLGAGQPLALPDPDVIDAYEVSPGVWVTGPAGAGAGTTIPSTPLLSQPASPLLLGSGLGTAAQTTSTALVPFGPGQIYLAGLWNSFPNLFALTSEYSWLTATRMPDMTLLEDLLVQHGLETTFRPDAASTGIGNVFGGLTKRVRSLLGLSQSSGNPISIYEGLPGIVDPRTYDSESRLRLKYAANRYYSQSVALGGGGVSDLARAAGQAVADAVPYDSEWLRSVYVDNARALHPADRARDSTEIIECGAGVCRHQAPLVVQTLIDVGFEDAIQIRYFFINAAGQEVGHTLAYIPSRGIFVNIYSDNTVAIETIEDVLRAQPGIVGWEMRNPINNMYYTVDLPVSLASQPVSGVPNPAFDAAGGVPAPATGDFVTPVIGGVQPSAGLDYNRLNREIAAIQDSGIVNVGAYLYGQNRYNDAEIAYMLQGLDGYLEGVVADKEGTIISDFVGGIRELASRLGIGESPQMTFLERMHDRTGGDSPVLHRGDVIQIIAEEENDAFTVSFQNYIEELGYDFDDAGIMIGPDGLPVLFDPRYDFPTMTQQEIAGEWENLTDEEQRIYRTYYGNTPAIGGGMPDPASGLSVPSTSTGGVDVNALARHYRDNVRFDNLEDWEDIVRGVPSEDLERLDQACLDLGLPPCVPGSGGLAVAPGSQAVRYQDWVDAQERRFFTDPDLFVPSGETGAYRGGFNYINHGDTMVHYGADSFPDALMDIANVPVRTEHAGGVWQVSVFVQENARGSGLGTRMLDMSEGMVRRRLSDLGRASGTAVIQNVIYAPPGDPSYTTMRNYFLSNGYEEVVDPTGTVYQKVINLN